MYKPPPHTCFLCNKGYYDVGIATHLRRTHNVKLLVNQLISLTESDKKLIVQWVTSHPNKMLDMEELKSIKAKALLKNICAQPVSHDACVRKNNMSIIRAAVRTIQRREVSPSDDEDDFDALEALIELRMRR